MVESIIHILLAGGIIANAIAGLTRSYTLEKLNKCVDIHREGILTLLNGWKNGLELIEDVAKHSHENELRIIKCERELEERHEEN